MAGRTTFLDGKKLVYCIPSFVRRIKTMRQKEPFFSNKAKNQFHSFSHTKIAASFNRKNLWLLLNARKVSPLSVNLSEKKRC
jgi:beta-glucosidase-like glycosyl hydrolase